MEPNTTLTEAHEEGDDDEQHERKSAESETEGIATPSLFVDSHTTYLKRLLKVGLTFVKEKREVSLSSPSNNGGQKKKKKEEEEEYEGSRLKGGDPIQPSSSCCPHLRSPSSSSSFCDTRLSLPFLSVSASESVVDSVSSRALTSIDSSFCSSTSASSSASSSASLAPSPSFSSNPPVSSPFCPEPLLSDVESQGLPHLLSVVYWVIATLSILRTSKKLGSEDAGEIGEDDETTNGTLRMVRCEDAGESQVSSPHKRKCCCHLCAIPPFLIRELSLLWHSCLGIAYKASPASSSSSSSPFYDDSSSLYSLSLSSSFSSSHFSSSLASCQSTSASPSSLSRATATESCREMPYVLPSLLIAGFSPYPLDFYMGLRLTTSHSARLSSHCAADSVHPSTESPSSSSSLPSATSLSSLYSAVSNDGMRPLSVFPSSSPIHKVMCYSDNGAATCPSLAETPDVILPGVSTLSTLAGLQIALLLTHYHHNFREQTPVRQDSSSLSHFTTSPLDHTAEPSSPCSPLPHFSLSNLKSVSSSSNCPPAAPQAHPSEEAPLSAFWLYTSIRRFLLSCRFANRIDALYSTQDEDVRFAMSALSGDAILTILQNTEKQFDNRVRLSKSVRDSTLPSGYSSNGSDSTDSTLPCLFSFPFSVDHVCVAASTATTSSRSSSLPRQCSSSFAPPLPSVELLKDPLVELLVRCQNSDGGFGGRPGAESHAGTTYCAVTCLWRYGALDRVDRRRLLWWLSDRQCIQELTAEETNAVAAGMNGRTGKASDVCYSYWVVASLCLLAPSFFEDLNQLINVDSLVLYILNCQDVASPLQRRPVTAGQTTPPSSDGGGGGRSLSVEGGGGGFTKQAVKKRCRRLRKGVLSAVAEETTPAEDTSEEGKEDEDVKPQADPFHTYFATAALALLVHPLRKEYSTNRREPESLFCRGTSTTLDNVGGGKDNATAAKKTLATNAVNEERTTTTTTTTTANENWSEMPTKSVAHRLCRFCLLKNRKSHDSSNFHRVLFCPPSEVAVEHHHHHHHDHHDHDHHHLHTLCQTDGDTPPCRSIQSEQNVSYLQTAQATNGGSVASSDSATSGREKALLVSEPKALRTWNDFATTTSRIISPPPPIFTTATATPGSSLGFFGLLEEDGDCYQRRQIEPKCGMCLLYADLRNRLNEVHPAYAVPLHITL